MRLYLWDLEQSKPQLKPQSLGKYRRLCAGKCSLDDDDDNDDDDGDCTDEGSVGLHDAPLISPSDGEQFPRDDEPPCASTLAFYFNF